MGTSTIRSRYSSDYGSHLLSDRAVKLVRNICIEENFITATGIVDNDFVLIMLKYSVIMFFQCHDGRSLEQNRKIARQKMQEALDKHFKGEKRIKEEKKNFRKGRLPPNINLRLKITEFLIYALMFS